MPPSDPPIRVVQCPKCGSPIEGASPGEIVTCSYCGATLQVSAGASGHPIARLATIETSTVYLARTEALKRLQGQLAERDEALDVLREAHRAKQQEAEAASKDMGGCLLWAGAIALVTFLAVDPYAGLGVTVALILVLIAIASGKKRRAERIAQEADAILQEGLAARAERDRLAQRIAELEASLDDLADQI